MSVRLSFFADLEVDLAGLWIVLRVQCRQRDRRIDAALSIASVSTPCSVFGTGSPR